MVFLNIDLICSISYVNELNYNPVLNLQQFYADVDAQDAGYNDSYSENINLTQEYTTASSTALPLPISNKNINLHASTSTSTSTNDLRYSPYPHPKYGVFRPMEWTSKVL